MAAKIDPVTLTFDLLTLKSVWESHVTWGSPVQSFVFLGLLVFELFTMYATDRQTDGRTKTTLDAPYPTGGGIKTKGEESTRARGSIGEISNLFIGLIFQSIKFLK